MIFWLGILNLFFGTHAATRTALETDIRLVGGPTVNEGRVYQNQRVFRSILGLFWIFFIKVP